MLESAPTRTSSAFMKEDPAPTRGELLGYGGAWPKRVHLSSWSSLSGQLVTDGSDALAFCGPPGNRTFRTTFASPRRCAIRPAAHSQRVATRLSRRRAA